jgi:hypothetical protein
MANDGTLTERERLVYSAKLAEQAERYDGAPRFHNGFFSHTTHARALSKKTRARFSARAPSVAVTSHAPLTLP